MTPPLMIIMILEIIWRIKIELLIIQIQQKYVLFFYEYFVLNLNWVLVDIWIHSPPFYFDFILLCNGNRIWNRYENAIGIPGLFFIQRRLLHNANTFGGRHWSNGLNKDVDVDTLWHLIIVALGWCVGAKCIQIESEKLKKPSLLICVGAWWSKHKQQMHPAWKWKAEKPCPLMCVGAW